ncbi:MAG TPA: hypothetical protein VGU64_18130, partial [Terriglobales bacterium]|nr:hypothetical protein [Terriglobales bacterium]
MIRVILPFHLRNLAHAGSEVTLEVADLETRPGHAAPVLDARAANQKCSPLSHAARHKDRLRSTWVV